ncbi:hypothetical protein [uncultured Duncaniella sp.]|uniref:hypothetical protein n=1 Tax=uncultured Duncaniella sp. TaxID=2768039 RepID=UPI0026E587DB|nr:hypothetical protein [uncultured Duncaniella sp.]
MKKLVLMFAVVFGMSFFACGNKEAAAEATAEACDSACTEVAEVAAAAEVVDSLGDSTVVAEVAEVAAPAEAAQ